MSLLRWIAKWLPFWTICFLAGPVVAGAIAGAIC